MAALVPDPASVICLLVLIALVLGASTIFSVRGVSWKTGFKHGLGSLLWASPVIAVLALVATRVLPQFQFGSVASSSTEASPSWLETEDGPVEVEEVQQFPEVASHVSIDLEETPKAALPDWTEHEVQKRNSFNKSPAQSEEWRVVLESKDWDVSVEDAQANLAKQAAQILEEDFSRTHSERTHVSPDDVQSLAVRAEAVTSQVFNKDSKPFRGYKVYWQVELSPEVREQLSDSWKAEVGVKRAWLLGGIFALLTLMAGTFAAYFHLDKRSEGAHRFRLKLAAAAMMTAGSLGLLAALPNVCDIEFNAHCPLPGFSPKDPGFSV